MSELLNAALSAYRDPMFWLFPVATTVISMAAFLVFALPLTWISLVDAAWARPYKIQSRHDRHIGVREALSRWFANNVQALLLIVLLWPLIQPWSSLHAGSLPAPWIIVLQLLFFIYLDDFLYYWMHRALHTRWLLKHVHGVHHRIYAPRAISGHYMHSLEYGLTGLLVLVGPLLLGAHVVVLWLWVSFRQWEAAEGHCGYDFPWSPTRWLPFSDGAAHHDFHHSRIKGNYAGFLHWTDRAFGTLVSGYEAERERLRSGKPDAQPRATREDSPPQ